MPTPAAAASSWLGLAAAGNDPARLASIAEELRTQRVPLLAPAKGGLLPIVWVPVLLAALVLGGVLYAFFA